MTPDGYNPVKTRRLPLGEEYVYEGEMSCRPRFISTKQGGAGITNDASPTKVNP